MTDPTSGGRQGRFEPPYPALIALALCTAWIAVLSLPMWSGQFLAGPWSDQYATGYAWRHWQAEQWRALGHIPLWNPDIFGGLPYVAAMHGDIFYPTAWLRLLLPTALAMNLGFVVHYILAGWFSYLLLRRLGVSWTGAVVGGLAYQLSGVIGTYAQPGHDGKLFVTALLPLALLSLVIAMRERRFYGHGLLALTVGLSLLSPHYQMVYYLLIASGLFALYLAFGEPSERPLSSRLTDLGIAMAAVAVGFGVAMIQIIPFFHYIPFSPRAEGYRGFEGSASFAIPWEHVPEFFLSRFVGDRLTYWGSNGLKLHSEYLGLPVVALAGFGAVGGRRKLVIWVAAIGLLMLLVSLGASTPFYRLWYEIMPYVKQTRAPGMALFVTAFSVSVLAALGAERLERGEGKQVTLAWLGVAAGIVLFALLGVFGAVASVLAEGVAQSTGAIAAQTVEQARSGIRWGAVGSGVALGALGVLALAGLRGHLKPSVLSLGLALIVGGDLWWNCHGFWTFSNAHKELHGTDEAVEYLAQTPRPYRVLSLGNTYPGSMLMTHDVPQLLGHHGNELHRFDELMGGKNVWSNLLQGDLKLWRLFAIGHVVVPTGSGIETALPGFAQRYEKALGGVRASSGAEVDVFTALDPPPYARLVPAAVKVPVEQASPTLLDPRFELDRLVLLDPDADVDPPALTVMPEPLTNAVGFTSWRNGAMQLRIDPPADHDAYLLVSENWYPDWKAEVDGSPAAVVRGNVSLMAVRVPAGAQRVELRFESADYRLGRLITVASLVLIGLTMIVPTLTRRRAGA